jgi:hypothetical protein
MPDTLYLKWGTLKGWDLKSDAAVAAGKAYAECGKHSASAMLQHDTPEQVDLLCKLIDAIDGTIINDWSGEKMTAEQAKEYVREYPREDVHG